MKPGNYRVIRRNGLYMAVQWNRLAQEYQVIASAPTEAQLFGQTQSGNRYLSNPLEVDDDINGMFQEGL